MCVGEGRRGLLFGEDGVGLWEKEWYERPHYERVRALAGKWGDEMDVDDFTQRILREVVKEPPKAPVWGLGIQPAIPQTEEKMEVGLGELEKGLVSKSKLWEEIGLDEVDILVEMGYMVASAFVHWEGVDEDGKRKGRFVENFEPHKEWGWGDGSVRMEKPANFAAQVEKGDSFLSFDIKAGYRHFFLHPSVRDFFLFHYGRRYFRPNLPYERLKQIHKPKC